MDLQPSFLLPTVPKTPSLQLTEKQEENQGRFLDVMLISYTDGNLEDLQDRLGSSVGFNVAVAQPGAFSWAAVQ